MDKRDIGAVTRFLRIDRTVSSLSMAIDFYCGALGFELTQPERDIDADLLANAITGPGRSARLRLGQQELGLTSFERPGLPYPASSTAADLWFQHIAIVSGDIAAAYDRLKNYSYQPISRNGPVTLPAESAGVIACKFRDPDGHPVELIQFPPGISGSVRQAEFDGNPTIGIDHSAISVSDADSSIAFYTRVLGLNLASRQLNQGSAQESLDAISDDRVEVVALYPPYAQTPHIELLAYRRPQSLANPILFDPNDIAADRLVLEVDKLAAILARLTDSKHPEAPAWNGSSALIRDPDGHFLALMEGERDNS